MNDNIPADEDRRSRGLAWFDAYVARIENAVLPEPAMVSPLTGKGVYRCPCCGYPTLDERGGYEICPLCDWEDDGQDDPQADEVWGGPNRDYSLAEARQNFAQHRIMYRPGDDRRLGGPDSERELGAKMQIMAAFDAMKAPDIDDAAWESLWQSVGEGLAILLREKLRKAAEYEESLKSARKG